MANVEMLFQEKERVEIVEVTPSMASNLLANSNYNNRRIRHTVVSKYAKAMRDGDWKFSPETISVSKSGRLLNGQHRMSAVVESGVNCRFLFAFGFDDDVFSVIDRGATRTTSDALGIDRRVSEVATLLVKVHNYYGKRISITDADVMRASQCIKDAHDILVNCTNRARAIFSSAPFRLATAARIMRGDGDYALKMYKNLIDANIENMPPCGHAAIRSALNGRLGSGGAMKQFTILSAAWAVTDPSKENASKLYLSIRQESFEEIVRATGYVGT